MVERNNPSWISSIPWWVRWPSFGGGSLMLATIDGFPPSLQEWMRYLGIALAAFGLVAIVWHWLFKLRKRLGTAQLILVVAAFGTWLCFTAALGAAAWLLWKGGPVGLGAVAQTHPSTVAQPEVVLLPPDERHEIVWNPVKASGFSTAKEGDVELGKWRVPQFHLRSTNGVAANDANVEWHADIKGLGDLLKNSPRLKDVVNIVNDEIYLKGGEGIPTHVYYVKEHISYQVAFITTANPGAVAVIPIDIFSQLGLYVIAILPDGLGEQLGPFPFSVKVRWTLPTPGAQEYRVDAVATNVKPPGVSEPAIDALVQFSVKRAN